MCDTENAAWRHAIQGKGHTTLTEPTPGAAVQGAQNKSLLEDEIAPRHPGEGGNASNGERSLPIQQRSKTGKTTTIRRSRRNSCHTPRRPLTSSRAPRRPKPCPACLATPCPTKQVVRQTRRLPTRYVLSQYRQEYGYGGTYRAAQDIY